MEQHNSIENLLQKQSLQSSDSTNDTVITEKTYLKFGIKGNYFLTPILTVKEVIDGQIQIIQYPVPQLGHKGIINLRGSIIPILSPYENTMTKSECVKIIIFENSAHKLFGVTVCEVKKILLKQEQVRELEKSRDSVILIGNETYRPFSLIEELAG